jgi:hypothetical protein
MSEEINIQQDESTEANLNKINNQNADQKKFIIISVVVIIFVLAFVITATVLLLKAPSETTSTIRDIFIIFMALESLIIGIALVVLIVQLSTLINLMQNEIRPIINATNETVNTLKGTARFMSDNLTEPVIKINQFVAMIKRLIKPTSK